MKNRRVVVVAYDKLSTFEFAVPIEVFGYPRPEISPWYSFSICSTDKGPLRAVGGFSILVDKGLRTLSSAGTIVIPGWRDPKERPPEPFLRALRRAYERGARLVSLCSGAFVLAATGLLDNRCATTHWKYSEQLSQQYPSINVNPDVLYVDEGRILTAAGSAAGIDLCLHLVRRDFGADVANYVARRIVVPPPRDGGQAQFIERPVNESSNSDVAELMDWLRLNLEGQHSLETLASRMHVSVRTLARSFHEQAGTTPMRWLAGERVRYAQQLLETTDLGVEQVSLACGFGSAQLLRIHFHRRTGTSPTAYRALFGGDHVRGS